MTPLPREQFAVVDSHVYLNHAAVGVLSAHVHERLREFLDAHARLGVLGTVGYEMKMGEYRERLGRYLGASGEEIAYLRNAGDGATILAQSLDWKPGDELLLCGDEFPSNALPWLALRERAVNVRLLDVTHEPLTPQRLQAELRENTRVLALSWVRFHDGYRHDLAALTRVAHANGTLVFVDAIQGVGALQLDVRACDIDAAFGSGAKWLLALQGIGWLYLRRDLLDRLKLALPGWRSNADMWDFFAYDQPPVADASRFEGGTPNFIGALSIAAAIELFERCGAAQIEAQVLGLADHLDAELRASGACVACRRSPGTASGIVTFSIPARDSILLGRELQRLGFVTTYRRTGIRVSPHAYNTTQEIDRFIHAVRDCARPSP